MVSKVRNRKARRVKSARNLHADRLPLPYYRTMLPSLESLPSGRCLRAKYPLGSSFPALHALSPSLGNSSKRPSRNLESATFTTKTRNTFLSGCRPTGLTSSGMYTHLNLLQQDNMREFVATDEELVMLAILSGNLCLSESVFES
jgi:hypothetical protein